jgi:hypothetical protein
VIRSASELPAVSAARELLVPRPVPNTQIFLRTNNLHARLVMVACDTESLPS